jgi:mannitol-1-phosphate/altronate dehydrogenase
MSAQPASSGLSPVTLNNQGLGQLLPSVSVPNYPRNQMQCGIVHLGFGGFHRAHMARYTHELMELSFADSKDYAIVGVGLMPADQKMRDSLVPQDCLYTLVERDGVSEKVAVIGSVKEIIYAGETTAELLECIDRPTVKIVSLTVTENGYCLNAVTKKLDPEHKLIKQDLLTPTTPKSAIGVIVEAYNRRMKSGKQAFTALSCDNIQHNGNVLREAVLSFAKLRDAALAAWIEQNATFPNTMVDRITPVTKPADIDYVQHKLGIYDQWPVVSEGFTQWVIEDKFVCGRPTWEKVGAQFVADVEPYEIMKLRLLNASHLAVACLGDLAGYVTIDETMSNPLFQRYMAALMDRETGPTLAPVPGIDLPVYKKTLIERFANPSIKDTVERVATDAPLNTVLASIRDRLKTGGDINLLCLALAGWLRRVRGVNEKNIEFVVRHPLADLLKEKAIAGGSDPRPLLTISQLFGELGSDARVIEPTQRHLTSLYANGALRTLENVANEAGF